MSAGVGRSKATSQKHHLIRRLAEGQAALALVSVLSKGGRAVVVDMHAGDGKGVEADQGELFYRSESRATPVIAASIAGMLRSRGVSCDLIFCERSKKAREKLWPLAEKHQAIIVRRHQDIKTQGYAWGLILNDPNGPGDHGDETLTRIARDMPRADFILVVNEGAIWEILSVKTPSSNPNALPWNRSVESIAAQHQKVQWRLDPEAWGLLLHRSAVLASHTLIKSNRMKGRILLVSNRPQTLPTGFQLFSVGARVTPARQTRSASGKSAAPAAPGRDRPNRNGLTLWI